MDKFLQRYKLLKPYQELTNMNKPITSKESDINFKTTSKKSPGPAAFTDKFHQIFKEVFILILHKAFQKNRT